MERLRYLFTIFLTAFILPAYANMNSYSAKKDENFKFIKYDLSYLANHETNPNLQVSLSFKGDLSGLTTLILPFQIAEVNDLYNNIENLHAINARIEKTIDPKKYLIHHAPNEVVVVTYQVKQAWQGRPTNFQQSLLPILQSDYFQFPGEGAFIYPASYKDEKYVPVILNWQVPSKWIIANSYGSHQAHQRIATNLNELLRGLYIAGNFRLYQTQIKNGKIWTAIYGKWPFKDDEFNHVMEKIISSGRAFWGDKSPYYLATVIPIGAGCHGATGTGHTHSFSAFLNDNCTLTNNHILYILFHETFHNWNNHADFFGELDKKREIYYYWFSEGFTDYYANLLGLRLGFMDFDNYIKRYNKVLADYYLSTVNSVTIEHIAENIWQDFNLERLVYQQGEILAHNWDTQIKLATKSQSLDDLMRTLWNSVKSEKSKLTLEKMSQLAEKYNKNDLLQEINSLYAGKLLVPNQHSLGRCVDLTMKMLAPYNPGFDIEASKKEGQIINIKPDSRAFAAGIREGQQLISIEEHPEDLSQTMEVTIKEAGIIKAIKFYPYSGELKPIPQFVLNQSMWQDQPALCLAWFHKSAKKKILLYED